MHDSTSNSPVNSACNNEDSLNVDISNARNRLPLSTDLTAGTQVDHAMDIGEKDSDGDELMTEKKIASTSKEILQSTKDFNGV